MESGIFNDLSIIKRDCIQGPYLAKEVKVFYGPAPEYKFERFRSVEVTLNFES
jgi:hypothetical protein